MTTSRSLIAIAVAVLCGCASPPTPVPTSHPTPFPTVIFATPTVIVATPTVVATSAVTVATPTAVVSAPSVGALEHWIEVDLVAQVVRLRQGDQVVAEYPASSGVAISAETTTPPGVYQVQQMIKGPIENVPGVFVSDILIFDWAAGNGIHSMPTDKDGTVLDSTLGQPVTAGCVRVAESASVFEFAQLGTTVWIH